MVPGGRYPVIQRQRVFLLHLQDKESGAVWLYTPQRDDPTYLSGRFMGCRRR